MRYLFGPAAVSDSILATTSSTGTTSWYITDQLGSVDYVENTSATVLDAITYDAFGNILSQSDSSDASRFMFAGMQYDATTGLYYDHARYYDEAIGRFMRQDPKGFAAGDTNLYRYVDNAPTMSTDPTGETLGTAIAATAIGAAGGAIGGMAGETVTQAWSWWNGDGFRPNYWRAGLSGAAGGAAAGLVAGGTADPVTAIMIGGYWRTWGANAAAGAATNGTLGLFDWLGQPGSVPLPPINDWEYYNGTDLTNEPGYNPPKPSSPDPYYVAPYLTSKPSPGTPVIIGPNDPRSPYYNNPPSDSPE